ncbi:hypothetical protein PCI56_13520 [Plesiomonas shigelloides subsp. oncorhynchi]|nr:hypothetical protein [Plesiomonas shigelloides]
MIRNAVQAEKLAFDAHTSALTRDAAATLALQQAQRQATVTVEFLNQHLMLASQHWHLSVVLLVWLLAH